MMSVEAIKARILNEYRKYAHKEAHFEKDFWAEAAARKILATMIAEKETGKVKHCFWHGQFIEEKCPACISTVVEVFDGKKR
jgi:hypothetical protein